MHGSTFLRFCRPLRYHLAADRRRGQENRALLPTVPTGRRAGLVDHLRKLHQHPAHPCTLAGRAVEARVGYDEELDGDFQGFLRDRSHEKFPRQSDDGPVYGVFEDELPSFGTNLSDLLNQGPVRNVVYVDPVFARVQEAILLLAVTLGSLLLWVTMSRQTGLRSDTKGLAAIASMATPIRSSSMNYRR